MAFINININNDYRNKMVIIKNITEENKMNKIKWEDMPWYLQTAVIVSLFLGAMYILVFISGMLGA
jgi:hypothetical protein